jgi:hypothetical protein
MQKPSKKKAVREPVQVYLDERDSRLLEELTERLELSKAEALRVGLRRLAVQVVAENQPGHALSALVGSLDASPDVPRDLAAKHDDYLYGKAKG